MKDPGSVNLSSRESESMQRAADGSLLRLRQDRSRIEDQSFNHSGRYSQLIVRDGNQDHSLVAGWELQLNRRLDARTLLDNGVSRLADFGDDVQAATRPGTRLWDVLQALFPCGSITGAPKIRTMEIIRELEAEPRGLYTGAIGWFGPGAAMHCNIAIRTLVHRQGRVRGNAGGGHGDSAAAFVLSLWMCGAGKAERSAEDRRVMGAGGMRAGGARWREVRCARGMHVVGAPGERCEQCYPSSETGAA